MMTFPVSGVETFWWLPILVAFLISALTSTGGVSGAFLILPYQISFLGFTGPAVSSTNLLYNIIATPGGVYRYFKEGRMVWPLAWLIVIGTLPGLVLGAFLRVVWLIEPSRFKFFVGLVLLYIAGRLVFNIFKKSKTTTNQDINITQSSLTLQSLKIYLGDKEHDISTIKLLTLTIIVGIIGGAYGIGGGAIVAPFLVAVFGLPVYSVAGAALFGTFVSSIAGVAIYYYVIPIIVSGQQPVGPDWTLGILFGVGGLLGTYVGARLQRFLPSRVIKIILFLSLAFIAIKYIGGYLF